MHQEITSIKDPKVVEAKAIQTAKGRILNQKFLLEGEKPILWAIDFSCPIEWVFVHDKQKEHPLVEQLRQRKIPVYFVSEGISKKITDTSYLIPFIGVAVSPQEHKECQGNLVVVLDHLQDLGNIGTIVRTAEAFGIHEFVTLDADSDLFYRKTIDASRGTVLKAKVHRCSSTEEAIIYLKKSGYQIVVTTLDESVSQPFAPVGQKPIAIVFGNETEGVSKEMIEAADLKIQIPMSGSVESLNVGVAAGISLYEMKRKMVFAMLTKHIQSSLARDLAIGKGWLRKVFDVKLREKTPLTAELAIAMMLLHVEGEIDLKDLIRDVGVSSEDAFREEMNRGIELGFIASQGEKYTLVEKGKEALAKIWMIHELVENIALQGVSEEEKRVFTKVLGQIFQNCATVTPYE